MNLIFFKIMVMTEQNKLLYNYSSISKITGYIIRHDYNAHQVEPLSAHLTLEKGPSCCLVSPWAI